MSLGQTQAIGMPGKPCPAALQLLGRFSLRIDGREMSESLRYDRVRVLLAALALAQGSALSRQELAELIWPQEPLSTGRARLRHALHTLRAAFCALPQALCIDASRVALREHVLDVDVLSILQADAGLSGLDDAARLSAYGGVLLDGLKQPEGDSFQAWYALWDTRLQIALASSRNRLVEQHIREGNFAGIIDQVQAWVALWPADEVCHRHRIRLLLGLGQRDAALHAYAHCVAALAQHAGTTPTVETRALLGLAQQSLGPLPAVADTRENQQHGYRPLAVLAIALGWRGESAPDPEDAIAHMQTARQRVLDVLLSLGVWIPQPDDSTLLAYFGYPAGSERPVAQAATAARLLARTEFQASIQLGIGLHADIALAGPGTRPDLGGLVSQKALALAWQAQHQEIRLSPEAVARIDGHEVLSQRERAGSLFLLQRQRAAIQPQRMHGRALEFDNLVQQWARLTPGRAPTSIQLSGPAGIGKSLLAQALVDYVEKTGGESIYLSCEENGGDMPWRPLVAWLQDMVSAGLAPATHSPDRSPESELPLVRQFLQKSLALCADDAQELWNMMHARGTAHVPHLAQSAYKAAIEALTGRVRAAVPLLLVLENLHWADRGTVALFEHLAARTYAGPLMILVTTRDGRRAGWVARHLSLAPLGRSAMGELVAIRARSERVGRELRMAIVDQSQGIPRYAIALLQQAASRHVSDHAPSVTDLVCAWVNQSGRDLRAVLLALALCGRPIRIEPLQSVLAMGRPKLENAVRQLERQFLASHEDGEVQCPILVRQAMVRITSRDERRRTHERLAQYFIETAGNAQEIAYHLRDWQDRGVEDSR